MSLQSSFDGFFLSIFFVEVLFMKVGSMKRDSFFSVVFSLILSIFFGLIGSFFPLNLQAQINPDELNGILKFEMPGFVEMSVLPKIQYTLDIVDTPTLKFSNEMGYILALNPAGKWMLYKTVEFTKEISLPSGNYQLVVNRLRSPFSIESKKTIVLGLTQIFISKKAPWVESFAIGDSESDELFTFQANLNQALVFPTAMAKDTDDAYAPEIVIYAQAEADPNAPASNRRRVKLSKKPGVQPIDLNIYFRPIKINAPVGRFPNYPISGGAYIVTNQFQEKAWIPWSDSYVYYLSEDFRDRKFGFSKLKIGEVSYLPEGACPDFELNMRRVSTCVEGSGATLTLGRIEFQKNPVGYFTIETKGEDGQYQSVFGSNGKTGSYGFPLVQGDYRIGFFEKIGSAYTNVDSRIVRVNAGQVVELTAPPPSTRSLQMVWPAAPPPEASYSQFFPPSKAVLAGPTESGSEAAVVYVVNKEGQVVDALGGAPNNRETKLVPDSYNLWCSGSQRQIVLDGNEVQQTVELKQLGVAKTPNTGDGAVFFAAQILTSTNEQPFEQSLFKTPVAIPYGKFLFVLPGKYVVTLCPFGEQNSCIKENVELH
jgi:hypothetical protein